MALAEGAGIEGQEEKTYKVWVQVPYWCRVKASNAKEAGERAVQAGEWEPVNHDTMPAEEDIYEIELEE